ncbi:DUF5658 family protein [Chloroflexota bacterium]
MDILKVPRRFVIKSHTMRLMLYTLFALIVADGLITQFLVTTGHALEVNPFLRAWAGQELFLAIKVSGAFLATLLLWIKYDKYPKLVNTITGVFLILYTGVIFWNLFVFLVT